MRMTAGICAMVLLGGPAIHVEYRHQRAYLVEGRDSYEVRLLADDAGSGNPKALKIEWGSRASLENQYGFDKADHLILKQGSKIEQNIDETELGKAWLAQDSLWQGGHATANNLRYAVTKSIFGQLVLPPESKGRFALGVATFVNTTSLPQVKREALIRIDLTSPLKFTFVKDLGYVGAKSTVVAAFHERVFKLGGGWYVYDTDGLHEMSPAGVIGKLCFAPKGEWYPWGVADGKALIVEEGVSTLGKWTPKEGYRELSKSFRLSEGSSPVVDGSRFLVTDSNVIDSASGRSIERTGPNRIRVWRSHLLEWDGHFVTVLSAATGKVQAKLRATILGTSQQERSQLSRLLVSDLGKQF
jgi:hypothetical protein